ncbi:NADH-quinone oxidoreductase subunit NuoI [Helicobacter didelphidarum]|uniref:NADH-quinone oxidoreductase subunit I n=1 Tax=Helicobacter didelphidarum TaxID=2040648 RepID=A0A3D8IDJ7_9HELI|nr:NADH-quinone oxidoreductase subunit NuoI [Helicobacter didelphidarum]
MDNVEKVVITNTSQDSPLEKECITKEHYPSGDSLQIVKQSGSISTKQDYYFVSMESLPKNSFDSLKRSVKFSLGLDLFKGMALTIKEFFSKPVTLQYPFEAQPLSPRYRAVHNLQRMLESGNERCIGCGLCEKICTSNCIRILTHEGEDGRKKIDSYTINLGRCIYCGLCAEVCPELAIVMGTRFENASEQRAHFGLKEDLLKDLEEARFHKQLEFEGFGSPRPSADKEIKQTPLDYKINEV